MLAIELGMTNANQVNPNKEANQENEDNLFTEVKNNRHQFEIPDQLLVLKCFRPGFYS